MVAKFNELTASLDAKEAELKVSRSRILRLSHAIDEIAESARPYVADGGIVRKIFNLASDAAKV